MKRNISLLLTIILISMTCLFMTSTHAGAFDDITDVDSPSHICKQLGIKVCHSEKCTVGQNKAQKTSQKAMQNTTQKATQKPTAVKETTVETTTAAHETTVHKTTTASEKATTGYSTNNYAKQILELVNAERAKSGLSPLTLSTEVSKVAQLKADDMKKRNYFSHYSPVYGSAFNMLKNNGISYRTAGENIAKGQRTPSAVVTAWMNSPSHRANILNKNFKQLGVGYTTGSSPYWVQIFVG